MLRLVAVVTLLAVSSTAVFAAESPAVGQRKTIFKSFSRGNKEAASMLKGSTKFDLAKVQASLKQYATEAPRLKDLFPDDSKTGNTEALPAVWKTKADFNARFDKFTADATAATAVIKDEASFKSEWPKIAGSCSGCHKQYKD